MNSIKNIKNIIARTRWYHFYAWMTMLIRIQQANQNDGNGNRLSGNCACSPWVLSFYKMAK